ncbi:MAG TPA: hypothetical protein VJC37_00735, partial [Planctomycetota bacterium]|nr:hypothetical protein [Planctomycetota bacterium]
MLHRNATGPVPSGADNPSQARSGKTVPPRRDCSAGTSCATGNTSIKTPSANPGAKTAGVKTNRS